MSKLFAVVVAVALVLSGHYARSEPINLAQPQFGAIGGFIHFFQESAEPLGLSEVMQAEAAGRFKASTDAVLNFGIGARPVWLRFEVLNNGQDAVNRSLSVDSPWLDRLDVFFVRDGSLLDRFHLGDRLPFADRPMASRVFTLDQAFGPGHTRVYIRVEGVDPMVLPIHLRTAEQAEARGVSASYSYGFLYGVILALAAYNLMLFFSLRSRRYLTYTLYLSAFVLMNAAYTGHGLRFLWPDSPQWQQWSIPILMMLVMLLGFLFATTFLGTRKDFPRINRMVIGLCALAGGAELLAVALGDQLAALLVSFVCVFMYSGGMILLGATSLLAGNKSARYFLIATITHVSTASVTALAVWGFIPYSELAYRSVEIGMMLDAILLALALADQFRISQAQKIQAERLAKVDPLTQMNNRRGFYQLTQPRWNNGVRKRHAMSVIALDIDRFKSINDRYGHAQGDKVIAEVARVLRVGMRDSDIAARWGGEEFILFLDETGMEEAATIAERFRCAIADISLDLNGDSVAITASFGVAQIVSGTGMIDDLINTADERLYMAKGLGRNQVCSQGKKIDVDGAELTTVPPT